MSRVGLPRGSVRVPAPGAKPVRVPPDVMIGRIDEAVDGWETARAALAEAAKAAPARTAKAARAVPTRAAPLKG